MFWSQKKLFKIFHSAKVSASGDSNDAVENRMSKECVCAFKTVNGSILSLDCKGQIVENDTPLSIEARPSSAVCLASGRHSSLLPNQALGGCVQ